MLCCTGHVHSFSEPICEHCLVMSAPLGCLRKGVTQGKCTHGMEGSLHPSAVYPVTLYPVLASPLGVTGLGRWLWGPGTWARTWELASSEYRLFNLFPYSRLSLSPQILNTCGPRWAVGDP